MNADPRQALLNDLNEVIVRANEQLVPLHALMVEYLNCQETTSKWAERSWMKAEEAILSRAAHDIRLIVQETTQ